MVGVGPQAPKPARDAEAVAAAVVDLLAEYLDMEGSALDPGDELISDLGMDSLDAVEFLTRLSERWDVDVDIDEIDGLTTLGDVLELARRRFAEPR